MPASSRVRRVPPVLSNWTPAAASRFAKSTTPLLSLTLSSARRMRGDSIVSAQSWNEGGSDSPRQDDSTRSGPVQRARLPRPGEPPSGDRRKGRRDADRTIPRPAFLSTRERNPGRWLARKPCIEQGERPRSPFGLWPSGLPNRANPTESDQPSCRTPVAWLVSVFRNRGRSRRGEKGDRFFDPPFFVIYIRLARDSNRSRAQDRCGRRRTKSGAPRQLGRRPTSRPEDSQTHGVGRRTSPPGATRVGQKIAPPSRQAR